MEGQNPGPSRLHQNAPPAGTNAGGATKKPPAEPAPTALAKVGEVAQQAGTQVREKAGALAAEAGEKAKGMLGNQVEAGAVFLGHIGRSAKAAADTLEADAPQLAGFVRGMATSVADLSNTVRGQSPEALLDTASTYVRQNPALVLSAAAVCGFALTRLLQGGTWNGSRARTNGQSAAASRSDGL
jgi:ElaB/YqjD/DUF883 family membrane-anchored ribosome-binding protein